MFVCSRRNPEFTTEPRASQFLSNISLFFRFYRKVQDALEKQNRETFKKRDHEKRRVDEATEKAKELMRVKPSVFFSFNAAQENSICIGLNSHKDTTLET